MSEAPERIWAFYTPDDFDDTATITAYETVQHGGKEYRRADLPPTLSAAMELPEVKALLKPVSFAETDKALLTMKHEIVPQAEWLNSPLHIARLLSAILHDRLEAALAAIKETKT